ncbi:hypothetical protein DWU98_14650 [Dyella monticola]|uniref:Conjugal transfer protein TraJ n=1 Tax=Dyella monticola TaxID=1927958 RepID=A0A370WVJ1_9GAMM|nr:hypothetical protein [Dyella monticola]RDS80149.1 hypothetical protein DWU98_14650 [Dyella monticola]
MRHHKSQSCEVCERERPLKVYVTRSDRETITARAAMAGLPLSSFLARVALHTPIRCMVDHDMADAVLHLNVDVARVCEELKTWLATRPGEGASPEDIHQTLRELRALQQAMMVTISQICRPGYR